MIERDVTLMLTAAIVPVPGMERVGLTRVDPRQREQDYVDALGYFVRNHPRIRRIVLVESSGAPLDRLRRTAEDNPHGKDVEILGLDCNEYPSEYGGGYGEWRLMGQGLERSRLLADTRYFVKMTGRQWVLNATRILLALPESFDFAGDMLDTRLLPMLRRRPGRLETVDARFWVTTPDFFRQHILPLPADHREGVWFVEYPMFHALRPLLRTHRIVTRFRYEPAYRGVAGHLHKNYGSRKERVRRLMRSCLRTAAPWLWLSSPTR
jgi:hypothetical protein